LAKNSTEIFNEKVNLIYEYDKQSPLFVRVANNEIENNNSEQAIEILNEGIKKYKYYPVAHFLLAKAYTLIGNYNLAMKFVRSGNELLGSPKTADYYIKEIESVKKQRSLFELSRRNSFFADNTEEDNEPSLFDEEPIPEIDKGKLDSIDERLGEIAKEISKSKFEERESFPGGEANKEEKQGEKINIISETLAKIYIAQGELREAIDIYNQLLLKYPEKSSYYKEKIEELTDRLNK
jgi:tetratricopeptide (TPR) repeat protein